MSGRASIASSNESASESFPRRDFKVAETPTFQEKIASRAYRQYYSRIKDVIYPRLRSSPFFGPNIKRLKGELNSIYRYRVGDYRLFYTIDPEKRMVIILDINHRKDAYR